MDTLEKWIPEKVRTWREKKHWASEAGEEHKPLKKAFPYRQNLNSEESLTTTKKWMPVRKTNSATLLICIERCEMVCAASDLSSVNEKKWYIMIIFFFDKTYIEENKKLSWRISKKFTWKGLIVHWFEEK